MMAIEQNNNDFLRQLVHDMKSPLACLQMIINCSTKIIAEEKDNLLRSLNRLHNLVNSCNPIILGKTLSNIEDKLDLVEVIDNILAEKKIEYANLGLIFSYHKPENLNNLDITGIKSDVERMLSNLINNAIESVANKPPIITIRLAIEDDIVNLRIEDNGSGIPQHILNQINNSISVTHGKTTGQGLGITHTRKTLAKYGGKLDIESTSGVGTKIILTFPHANKLPDHNNSNTLARNKNITPPTISAVKAVDIVLVEDDRDNADIMATFMFQDKKVEIFDKAKEFLANFSKYPLDTAMLIDYQFPEENVNGIEICKELHAKGFTNFYLYSGMDFYPGEVPSYIKVIFKTDLNAIENLARE